MIEQNVTIFSDPEMVKTNLAIADLILKLLIALIGFYLAHSLSRQVSLRVSEKRLSAYAALWSITGRASPSRLHKGGAGPLKLEERITLQEELSVWYYTNGNGMLLADSTRTMFLKIKDNLTFPIEKVKPDKFSSELKGSDEKLLEALKTTKTFQGFSRDELREFIGDNLQDALRGTRLISQLSLLRTRMKADVGVFGIHYGVGIEESDHAFLVDCGELLWRRPWRKPLMQLVKDSYNKRMQSHRPKPASRSSVDC